MGTGVGVADATGVGLTEGAGVGVEVGTLPVISDGLREPSTWFVPENPYLAGPQAPVVRINDIKKTIFPMSHIPT